MTVQPYLKISEHAGFRTVTISFAAFVCLFLTIIALMLIVWSVKRRRNPRLTLAGHHDLESFMPTIAGLTHGALEDGNSVEILQNGEEFFPAVLEELNGAQHSINFETYLWKNGELARQIVEVLERKAHEGVMVRLLLDGSGGKKIGRKTTRQLRKSGCQVRRFHPIRLSNLGNINKRDHRKIIVVDGRVGFVGGHCIVDTWLGNAQDKKHFRDVSTRVEGPVVARLQSAFSENWIEETGDVPSGEKYFPKLDLKGNVRAHLTYVSTAGTTSSVKMLHYLAIHAARKQIRIQNPYFLPDPDAIDAFGEAVARGVDVRVMIPAVDATDNALVQHASHHRFGALLKKGVRLYEYNRTLLHQKVFTVDHHWSGIGSTNFDDRSFELNDEVTLGVFDEQIARRLEEIFEADLEHCKEVLPEAWKKRSFWHRGLDQLTFLMNEQL